MSVTGTQVITRLNTMFDDVANAKFFDWQKLEAVNAAIDNAWPSAKAVALDSSVTLATSTYEYSPSATPEVEWGFSVAYVSVTGNPKWMLRGVTQRQSGTAWTVRLPGQTASAFSAETLYLQYNTRIARIASAGTAIELPLDYLVKAAASFLADSAVLKGGQFATEQFERMAVKWAHDAEVALRHAARGDLPQMIHPYSEAALKSPIYSDEIPAP